MSKVIGRRYMLHEQLGVGGMGAVYRATDRLTGDVVALKRVTISPDQLAFASRSGDTDLTLALAQEFRTLASLHHPHIISVLDYGFDEDRQPYYTMDLLEDAQALLDAGRNQPLAIQVSLLVQTLQALAYLHRRGVLHRDLKPLNVLVVNGRVKVLDFGVSVVTSKTMEYVTQTTVGTFAYIAPELFTGAPFTRSSDLYAVGVMAYELFADRHPFDTTNPAVLLNDVLHTPADVRSIDVNDELAALLERLLAKTREERYGDTDQVIRDLCTATSCPLPAETIDIRESYLQAARFVGRDAELGQLGDVLRQAMTGRGSAWLVGGESGVGKSRLLDELRTLALVEGALVLRGQAVSEGGSPYHLWRDVLRWLALLTELNDLEASVLQMLVPDIDGLVGREVPDAPELDPQGTQDRLLMVIENIFLRQSQPTIVILEDLQWARESLNVLARLNRTVAESSLLLVGSYRDDERPDLPADLPGMQVLKLERFTEEEVAELSEAMLGADGREPRTVDLLQRESEGNPFFLVQVVRALAEEFGQLAQISSAALPTKIFARGVQEIVQRRLARVPQGARPLLQMAAILGRQLDLQVLRSIEPDTNLESWLTILGSVAILETRDGRWRFTHDKLRQGVLDELTEDVRPGLHRRAAEAIETLYPDAAERTAALAYHWGMAGDVDKERQYAALAGTQTLESGAYGEAIPFLKRALALHDVGTAPSLRMAALERQLGQAHFGMGQLAEARHHLQQAVAILGWPVPTTAGGVAVSLLGQVLRQVLHRIWPGRYVGRSRETTDTLLEGSRAYAVLGELCRFANEKLLFINAVLRTLNLAEAAGPFPELSRGYALACYMAGLASLRSLADAYSRRARDTVQDVERSATGAYAYFITGAYDLLVGRWDIAQDAVGRAAKIFERLGDQRFWAQCASVLGNVYYHRGKFGRCAEVWAEIYAAASKRNDPQQQSWALTWRALNLLRLAPTGHLDEAIASTEKAAALLAENIAHSDELFNYGVLAMARLRRGQPRLARQAAGRTAHLISLGPPVVWHLFEGYSGVAEVYLSLWEASGDRSPVEGKALAKSARQACKDMRRFARTFPFGKPRAHVWQGLYHWLNGKSRRAHKAWQAAIIEAERLNMPYERGLAHYQIGRHLDADDPARQEHLTRTAGIFTQLETAYDLARVQDALREA